MTGKDQKRPSHFAGLLARTGAKRIHWVPAPSTQQVRYENVEAYLGRIGKVGSL